MSAWVVFLQYRLEKLTSAAFEISSKTAIPGIVKSIVF
jgi:hypothetical protein